VSLLFRSSLVPVCSYDDEWIRNSPHWVSLGNVAMFAFAVIRGLAFTFGLPCLLNWLSLLVWMPLVLYTVVLRQWMLLFSFELTRDLVSIRAAMRPSDSVDAHLEANTADRHHALSTRHQQADGDIDGDGDAATAPSPLLTHRQHQHNNRTKKGRARSLAGAAVLLQWHQSWYTRHHHLGRGSFLKKVSIIVICIFIFAWIVPALVIGDVTTPSCLIDQAVYSAPVERWRNIAFICILLFLFVFCLVSSMLTYKLRRHEHDSYGLKQE
jgi:hypothetical protein